MSAEKSEVLHNCFRPFSSENERSCHARCISIGVPRIVSIYM